MNLRILPVIDLKDGCVVRGVAGRREAYRPIASLLCSEPTPVAVGDCFRHLGLTEVYVADLNAIGGEEPDWRTYAQLLDGGLRLLVDAGITTAARARQLADFHHGCQRLHGIIAGLESLQDVDELSKAIETVSPARLILSLDLRDGRPVTRVARWTALSAEAIAAEAAQLGNRRFVVLDVASVGVNRGVSTLQLCARLRRNHPGAEIISGGGVRGIEDLARLTAAGCDAALVASALHDGRLTADDLRPYQCV